MIKHYKLKCKKCGKMYEIDCEDHLFKRNKYNHYCSISCRNSHIVSDITKTKISESLKQEKHKICIVCGKDYISTSRGKFCSDKCKKLNKILPTLIKYFKFDKAYIGTINIYTEFNKIRQQLFDDYWKNNLSTVEIAKKYNYPQAENIGGKVFKYLDIPTRTLSDAIKLAYIENRMHLTDKTVTIYKEGWHKTWNNKEVYLRSSYEFDYAKYLDDNKINYEVEFKHIKYFDSQRQEYRCAIPDFYLSDINTIVEIKSNYTLDIQNMKDKIKAYKDQGYNFKLILEHKEIIIDNL